MPIVTRNWKKKLPVTPENHYCIPWRNKLTLFQFCLYCIGCYDCKMYVFNRFTGETHWTFQTGAAVKSSPCVDPKTGVVWVGSHDHHLYGLDVKHKQCICVIDCGGGSCFSSPCISSKPQLVFIATLDGHVLAVDPAEHTILWSQQFLNQYLHRYCWYPLALSALVWMGFFIVLTFKERKYGALRPKLRFFVHPHS